MDYKKQKTLTIKGSERVYSLNECSNTLNMALNQMSDANISYVFLGLYPDLPNSFSGNDIDILTTDLKSAEKIFKQNGFVVRNQSKDELRAFLYIPSSEEWVVVDIENFGAYPPQGKKILKFLISNSFKDKSTHLFHPSSAGILAYKIMKYVFNGYVHSWYQIMELQKKWTTLDETQRNSVLDLLSDFKLSSKTQYIFNLIASSKKEIFSDKNLQLYIDNMRKIRHHERLIYQGSINRKKLFTNPMALWKFFFGAFFKSKNALPAFALVGNDGSGKTEQCQRLKDELYKIDPLHIVMRGNEPWLPGWKKLRTSILRYLKNKNSKKIKKNIPYIWILSWIGEIGDFIDRWVRYKIGMAWANAGFGFTIFERFPTDRLRGEFPGPKWSLFPIEQYFPMPDLIILLDVDEHDSLKRKFDDGHSYQEMHEKRENYLRLIKEINPSVTISSEKNLVEIHKQISMLLWKYSVIKQSKRDSIRLPAVWAPEKGRKLADRDKQKEGFL